jgi:hypothetical protein
LGVVIIVHTARAVGHADSGIKLEFSSCCTKGNFYANPGLLHQGKILCQVCLAIQQGRPLLLLLLLLLLEY